MGKSTVTLLQSGNSRSRTRRTIVLSTTWKAPVNAKKPVEASAEVKSIAIASSSTVVSDDLTKLTDILHSVCPSDAVIEF